MHISQLAVLLFALPCSIISLNLPNNACPKLSLYPISSVSKECYYNTDILSNITNIVENRGYKLETNTLTTSDGYILNVYRISSKLKNATKAPVFLMYGIVINSGSWVDIGNRSLAFVLVDEGYEVWIGSWRGTKDSDKHVSLNINNPDYWDFSMDTLAKEDLRNQLKLVAEKSKIQQKIVYIGHSMGTTISYMYASEFSEEAEELLQGIVSLAPIASLNGVPIVEVAKPLGYFLISILEVLQMKSVFFQIETVHEVQNVVCEKLPHICKLMIDIIAGPTTKFPAESLLLFFSYWPERASIFLLKQYLQISDAKRLQKYDYGSQINEKIYGNDTPPKYDLSKISRIPVRFFYGEADSFYRKENVDELFDEMTSTNKRKYSTPTNGDGKYNHADFLYAEDLVENLYLVLLSAMNTSFQEET